MEFSNDAKKRMVKVGAGAATALMLYKMFQAFGAAASDHKISKSKKLYNDCMLLYICGDKSGSGKTTVCMGILESLIHQGYSPNDLGYIKPCTQCEVIQPVWKYCHSHSIEFCGVGPVRFYSGMTKECIDGKDKGVAWRHKEIQSAISKMSAGKRLILVDGVGYPAVGSCAGVSNAQVASLLNAPVLIIGRDGVGNAIDSSNFISAYFEKFHVKVLGAVYNKLPLMSTYHPFEECKEYVTKFFQKNNPTFGVYGHIPLLENLPQKPKTAGDDLNISDIEKDIIDKLVENVVKHMDIQSLLQDLNAYYGKEYLPSK